MYLRDRYWISINRSKLILSYHKLDGVRLLWIGPLFLSIQSKKSTVQGVNKLLLSVALLSFCYLMWQIVRIPFLYPTN